MSKSKGNVVDPEKIIGEYGVDTLRLFILFAAPPELDLDWSEKGIDGCRRFINRIWNLRLKLDTYRPVKIDSGKEDEFMRLLHRTIKGVTGDIRQEFQFNTAIAKMMELTNRIYKHLEQKDLPAETLHAAEEDIIRLLAPFTPHICEELWKRRGKKESVFDEKWPLWKTDMLEEQDLTVVIQINGKVRGKVKAGQGTGKERLLAIANDDPNISQWLKDKSIIKSIYVPGKILNIVTG